MLEKIPRYLYHGTTEEKALKIKDQGIKRFGDLECVFLADVEEDARKFASFHAMLPKLTSEQMDSDKAFEALIPNAIVVFKINAAILNPKLLNLSDDHNADFWELKGESYMYFGKVPRSALIDVNVFERKKSVADASRS